VRRVLLAAQDGGTTLFGVGNETLDSFLERRGGGKSIVKNVPLVVVELVSRRSAAQHVSEVKVAHPPAAQRGLERLTVEVDGVAAVGAAANVDEKANPVRADKIEEGLQGQV
jgi:hypothetical protein